MRDFILFEPRKNWFNDICYCLNNLECITVSLSCFKSGHTPSTYEGCLVCLFELKRRTDSVCRGLLSVMHKGEKTRP